MSWRNGRGPGSSKALIFGMLALAIVAAAFLLVGVGEGVDAVEGMVIIVDDDAAPGGNGTIEAPYQRIQWAIDNASDGDTIRVFDGKYNETVIVNRSVELVGNGSDTTIILRVSSEWTYYSNLTAVTVMANGTSISGFSIRDYFAVKFTENRTWYFERESSMTISSAENCTVTENSLSLSIFSSRNITVSNNLFNRSSSGITAKRTNNCVFEENEFRGSSFGIIMSYDERSRIHNNSLIDRSSSRWSPSGLSLSNCTGTSIQDNVLNGTYLGIRIFNSTRMKVIGNTCEGKDDAITIDNCTNVLLKKNVMAHVSLVLSGRELDHWITHTIHPSNLINGTAITFITNVTDRQLVVLGSNVIAVNCHNVIFSDMNCSDGYIGFTLARSSNITIRDSVFDRNSVTGLVLDDNPAHEASFITVTNCQFSRNVLSIWVGESSSVVISGNRISENLENGITVSSKLEHGRPVMISNNTIVNNSGYGILVGAYSVEVSNNTITGNRYDGILFREGGNCLIIGNTCSFNGHNGINVRYFSNVEVVGNICLNNTHNGLEMFGSANGTIESNTFDLNGRSGIYGDYVENSSVERNTCWNNTGRALALYYSNNNFISQNVLRNSSFGLHLSGWTYSNEVRNNTISGNGIGIRLKDLAVLNTITYNAIVDNREYGINSTVNYLDQDAVTWNWWGHPSGPYHPGNNVRGKGDRVSGLLEFDPWLKEWHDPAVVRTLDPIGFEAPEEDADEDDELDTARFALMLILVIIIAIGTILVLIMVLPEDSLKKAEGKKGTKGKGIETKEPSPAEDPKSALTAPSPTTSSTPLASSSSSSTPPAISSSTSPRPPTPPTPPSSTSPPPTRESKDRNDPPDASPPTSELRCPECDHVVGHDPEKPSIRITCPECGADVINKLFKSEPGKIYKS